ncbi:uncharacterized protein [Salminus brasiliensis]|uniref:uncharacterized protein n=1 Tax=Salminus brasiliensis TaxID=930266 RepID=UPI003B837DD0
MEENGRFQTQFTAVMESVLQAAVGEATKLFERTLHQLKAELLHLRQENADLKTGLFARQFKTRHAGDGPQRGDPSPGPPRCDTGVQCEKPLMVERCCSPAQFGEHPLQLQHITSDRLADLCSSASEDGNRQLALLLIKKEPQETECDDYAPGYFLLKQEGAEPILVRKEPFKNTMERVMIPSTFQTVSRCNGNPKEVSIANTISTTNPTSASNSVSCSHRVDASNDKVTQTTSTSTFRGLTPPSDKDRQKNSTSTKKLTLPEQPANSQSSVPVVNSSAPTVSLSLSSKVGQMPTPRSHPTAPAISVQMNRPTKPRANLNTPQPQQNVKNIQHPAAGTYLNPQPVPHPLPQRQNLVTGSCTSIQSLQAPVAMAKKRVLPASVNHTVTPLAQSSTQPRRPLLPPFESVIPQVQKMTPQGSVLGPRVQTPFSPDQHTAVPGQVPKPLSQIPPPLNHATNPSVQGPVPSVHGPLTSVKDPMPPIQGPVPSVRGPLPPEQSRILPMQGPSPPVQIRLPPVQGLLPPIQGSVPPIPGPRPLVQGPVPPVQNPVSSVPGPVPPIRSPVSSVHGQIPPVQSLVPSLQSPISSVHGTVLPIQGLVPVTPIHAQVHARSNETLPPNSQSLTQQAHFPCVPCHTGTTSARPHYPQTQIPFAKSYIPVQSMKSSVSPVSISQTNAPSPLEQIPVTTSHYQILSDPLCSSSDQFFSPPDNTSDLLQALPPMPFQSPIVLTQQEAALEQPSMIHLQSSGQPLQLAPLLTLKEQQLAASNQGSVFKRGPVIPGETMLSGVSNFEEHLQKYLPCSSSTISCEGKDSITNEMHNENSSENDQDSSTALKPGVREHYKVLSKPESNSSSRVHSQSSGQPLQLAPHLTQTEQQVAASNQGNVSKGEPAIPGEIMVPSVNNFEEHMQRFLPCSSPTISCEGNESITNEMHNGDSSDQDGRIAFMPGAREQYKVLSKPESDFRMLDSTKEQQTFRMNTVKDLHINSEVAEQNQTGCDAAGLVWEPTDSCSAFPHSALSGSAPNRGRTLQKASRRVLERNTECSECGRILSNASSLENHMRLHRGERPYNCSQCGKAFPSVRGLNRHVKVHAEEKGYKCEECGRCFVYQFTLTKHKLIHSGDRPYPCKICGKKFLAKADRSTHMRMHTGEKPFFCSQCGKTFKHRVALNMHLQGHKGEKRYVCPHCEKGFVDLGNFKRHKRIHTGEKPFECKDCGKRFTQSAHLKKHVNTQHAVSKISPP